MPDHTTPYTLDDFLGGLSRAPGSTGRTLDLTETDPARSGLCLDVGELEAVAEADGTPAAAPHAAEQARDAVASYLVGRKTSGASARVHFTTSAADAHRAWIAALCAAGDEILVPRPGHPLVASLAAERSVGVGTYRLAFDGAWCLDRASVRAAFTRGTRAVLVGNPSEPSGAILRPEDLAFLEGLGAPAGVALVGDERFADTALAPCASVLDATHCPAIHVSGLSGVCGLGRLEVEWLAVSGPEIPATARRPSRLDALPAVLAPPAASALRAVPALLARRGPYLAALRARLARNRALLASAALRESPWSVLGGSGGCWAVLEVGSAEPETSLCSALLQDGVAVHPGSRFGLPPEGFLVVSLLPPPDVFVEALSRIDRRLRSPTGP